MTKSSSGETNQPFDFEKENKFLKMTITELRNKMETLQIKQGEQIQLEKSMSADEIGHFDRASIWVRRCYCEKQEVNAAARRRRTNNGFRYCFQVNWLRLTNRMCDCQGV